MKALHITTHTLSQIHAAAKAAGRRECLGLLARKSGDDLVSSMALLPSVASSSSASAEPITLKRAADAMAANGLVPAGLWHSHATFSVFHSGTDQATIRRMFPAMASWSYHCPPSPFEAPTVLSQDSAIMRTSDGQAWVFNLVGEAIASGDGRLRAKWATVKTSFGRNEPPHGARIHDHQLILEGAQSSVLLGIPPGASITVAREESGHYRVARLFSLVVNNHGEECADCVTVHNYAGHIVVDQHPTRLVKVAEDADASDDSAASDHNGGMSGDVAGLLEPPSSRRAEGCS